MAGKNWPILPLGELTENFDGRRVPVKGRDRKPGPYPYYGASGIVDQVDDYLFDGEYLLIGEDGENLRTRQTPVAFIATGKFWVNNHAHIVRGNHRANTRFLSYALSQTEISGYLTGSTMPKLTQGNLNRVPVIAPPLAEQEAIVAVLGSLDDKIELNRRMNATLEAMARALFQSWFVDFDPVRAKLDGRPSGLDEATAALFPATFQDSLLGPIPQGWELKPLSDITAIITKGTTPTKEDIVSAQTSGSPINYVRVNAIDEDGSVLVDKLATIPESVHVGVLKRSILQADDVLYTIAGTIGRIAIAEDWVLPANTNQAVAIVRPKPIVPSGFLVLTMRHEIFREELHSNIVHAVQANLSLGMLSKARAIVPPEDMLPKIFKPIDDILSKISANRAQSRTLATLRDTLLPKLLSGELTLAKTDRNHGSKAAPL